MQKTVSITLNRYEELAMLVNTNKIQEAKIEELLAEIKVMNEELNYLYKYKDNGRHL